jgi:hypothetical protein
MKPEDRETLITDSLLTHQYTENPREPIDLKGSAAQMLDDQEVSDIVPQTPLAEINKFPLLGMGEKPKETTQGADLLHALTYPMRRVAGHMEKALWATIEGGLKAERALFKYAPDSSADFSFKRDMKNRKIGVLNELIDYWEQPGKYGYVSPQVDRERMENEEFNSKQSFVFGMVNNLAESVLDFGAFVAEIGMVGASGQAVSPAGISKLKYVGKTVMGAAKHLAPFALATTTGDFKERAKSAAVLTAFGSVGGIMQLTAWNKATTVAVASLLNTVITLPDIAAMIQESGGINKKFLKLFVPLMVFNIGFGLHSTKTYASKVKDISSFIEKVAPGEVPEAARIRIAEATLSVNENSGLEIKDVESSKETVNIQGGEVKDLVKTKNLREFLDVLKGRLRTKANEKLAEANAKALVDCERLAEQLGVKVDFEVIDEEKLIDPTTPEGRRALHEHGKSEEDIQNGIKAGKVWISAGTHDTSPTQGGGQIRSSVKLYRGYTPKDVYHEFAHAVEAQGGLPGWYGTPEQRAKYLEEKLYKGEASKINEFKGKGTLSPENAKAIIDEGVNPHADGSVTVDLNSVRTYEESQRLFLEVNDKKQVFDKETVDKFFKDQKNVAAFILKNPDLLDFKPATYLSALKDNSDPQYQKSLDFTTMCVKRYVMQSTIDAIQLDLNRPLNSEEIMGVVKMLKKQGIETSCGACYVESRRIHNETVVKKALEGYKITSGDRKGEWVEPLKVPRELLLTVDGIDRMAREFPEEYARYRKLFAGTQMKIPEARTEYNQEISKLSESMVEQMNNASGMQWQSWSDFELPHLLDGMQAIGDMALKGLKGQAYTKQQNFVEAFADTGMMINMSLIPKGDGFEADGKTLAFDETQSFPTKQAFKNREKWDNVGTVAIGISDKHIMALLKDPRIDYVIPYHASGLSHKFQQFVGMDGWKDYTKEQRQGYSKDAILALIEKKMKTAPSLEAGTRPDLYSADMEGMEGNQKKYKTDKKTGLELFKTDNGVVAKFKGKVVGFATKMSATETDVSVAKEFRGKGFGKKLYVEFLRKYPEMIDQTGGLTDVGRKTYASALQVILKETASDQAVYYNEHNGDLKKFDRLLKSRGITAQFSRMRDWEGYEKLLTDRRIYDRAGNRIEQKAVTPSFNSATLQRMLKNYEGPNYKPHSATVKKAVKEFGVQNSIRDKNAFDFEVFEEKMVRGEGADPEDVRLAIEMTKKQKGLNPSEIEDAALKNLDEVVNRNKLPTIKELVEKWENGDESIASVEDVVKGAEDVLEEKRANGEETDADYKLQKAINKFHKEQNYDTELKGRGDMDSARDEVMIAIEKHQASDGKLFIQLGKRKYPISSVTAASKKWNELRDQAMREAGPGAGPDEAGTPLLVDASGKTVGYISWNGEVWRGEPGVGKRVKWDAKEKNDFPERVEALKKQALKEGWSAAELGKKVMELNSIREKTDGLQTIEELTKVWEDAQPKKPKAKNLERLYEYYATLDGKDPAEIKKNFDAIRGQADFQDAVAEQRKMNEANNRVTTPDGVGVIVGKASEKIVGSQKAGDGFSVMDLAGAKDSPGYRVIVDEAGNPRVELAPGKYTVKTASGLKTFDAKDIKFSMKPLASIKDAMASLQEQAKAKAEKYLGREKLKELLPSDNEPTPATEARAKVASVPAQVSEPNIPGEKKQSGVSLNLEAQAVKKGLLSEGLNKLAEYEGINMEDQAQKASDLIKNDPERAKRVAMGSEPSQGGLKAMSVYVALRNKAMQERDVNTIRDLAGSSLNTVGSEAGQTLRILAEVGSEDPVTLIKKIIKVREEVAGKKVVEAKAKTVSELKKVVKAATPDKNKWNDFIESIRC